MIDKYNIKILNINTKKIYYTLDLDNGWWSKIEYDDIGEEIYYETNYGVIRHGR